MEGSIVSSTVDRSTVTIAITRQAADCLAWFIDHDMYPDTLSEIIVQHTTEWAHRERKDLCDLFVDGEFKRHFEK